MHVKHKSLYNAMKKAGYPIHEHARESMRGEPLENSYVVKNGQNIVSWFKQGDDAICVHATWVNDGRDSSSDYFPGHYPSTIKHAVSYLAKG